jgi:hypothetical protein
MDPDTARLWISITGAITSSALLWCALMLTEIRNQMRKRK